MLGQARIMLTMSGEKVQLPIPTIYFSSFMGDGVNDCLVIENLCSDSHFQVEYLLALLAEILV